MIDRFTFPLIITQRILVDDIVYFTQTLTIMKYVGILNLISYIIVIVLCTMVLFMPLMHIDDTIKCFWWMFANLFTFPLLAWTVMVFCNRLDKMLKK